MVAASEGIFGVTRIPMEGERKRIKRFLAIPEEYEVPCYVALGCPKATAARTEQKKVRIDEKIHLDAW